MVKRDTNKKPIFHFYFFNKDISLNIYDKNMKCSTGVKRIHTEGTVSQIFDLGIIFHFIKKKKKGNILSFFHI